MSLSESKKNHRLVTTLRGDAWTILNSVKAEDYDNLRNNLANLSDEDARLLRCFYDVESDEQVVHLAATFHGIHR